MNSSFSVVFDFDKDKFEFDIVYHNFSTGMLEVGASNIDVDVLNELLDSNYIESCNQMCNELYSSSYREYYRFASQGISRSLGFLGLIKCFIKAVFFEGRGEKNRELMLLHNISIETHRYVVSRALRYRTGKNE
jgi:poly-gamma-glutamate synthesis protein (capsule biosynthesis protein)